VLADVDAERKPDTCARADEGRCALTRLLLAVSASMTTSPTPVSASSPSASVMSAPLAIFAVVVPPA
jgi:hypothetical protein